MIFKEYETFVQSHRIYPAEQTIMYPILALCGEAGELANEYKKIMRDGRSGSYSPEERERMLLEAGDVLWYLTAVAKDLGSSLEEIAEKNMTKLSMRRAK